MFITDLFKSVGSFAGNHQGTILTGVGVTGVVTTAYLTGRATVKATQIIEKEEFKLRSEALAENREKLDEEGLPELSTKEKVQLVWPLYIPPVVAGITTITAIVAANHQASKKIAALTVAAGISERTLQEYKDKVVEKFGERKATDVRDSINQSRVDKNPPDNNRQIILTGKGEVLCMDSLTGRYFLSSMEELRRAENKINYEVLNHMYASLSHFYDEIGLAPTPYSETVGWNGNEMFELTFTTALTPDQRPCIVVDFARLPFVEYDRTWG